MISKWDDYPVHQAALPINAPLSSDPGKYERYWFAMHDTDLTTQVGFGLSVHPHRGIVDAALSIVHAGKQVSVFASGPLTLDRDLEVGPLRLEVVEPGRILRITLQETEGVSADLTFIAVTQHVEDGRMRRELAGTLISERVRTVQFGGWSGHMSWDGNVIECTPDKWWGFRDRSWGSRTTGTSAERNMPAAASNIYFAWTLLRFPDECLLVAVNEAPDGRSEARTVAVLPFLEPGDAPYGEDDKVLRGDAFQFDIDYVAGTRRAQEVHLSVGPRGEVSREIDLDLIGLFQMQGLGYYHPTWRHGTDHGGLAVGVERWELSELDPTRPENVHAQQITRATRSDGAVGLGLFEHVLVGPHLPSGMPEGRGARS